MEVRNVIIVPKYFISPDIIEKRKPLSPNARRAGWIGSNILIGRLPIDARIYVIKDSYILPKQIVRNAWKRFSFLEKTPISSKGWLSDVLSCIRKLDKKEFTLKEVYNFEEYLREIHPRNKHIRPKIRQQLQILRDRGILKFLGKGKYSIIE